MYKKLPVKKLTGAEQFTNTGGKTFSVLEFWQYGFSSLNSNVLRGPLAEFLVENALKDAKDIGIRNPWGDSDVEHQHTNVEVKSSSYLQDWDQNNLTAIRWTGLKAKKIFWNGAVAKQSTDDADYKSDVYVLALFKHQDHATLDILDMDQWCFYVLSKDHLREVSGDNRSVSLYALKKRNVEPVGFEELKSAIEQQL